jgi:hypothetical protein
MFTRLRAGSCLRLTFLGLAVTAAVGHAAPARACSPGCQTSVAVPSVGSLPGNLVSFKVLLDDPETLSLATAGGDAIATHIVTRGGERMFEPVEPLAAGSNLVLTYSECPGSGRLAEYAFTTGERSEIELRPSELAVAERTVLYPDRGDEAIAVVRLSYTSPDALGSAGHLVEHSATIDGHPIFFSKTIDGVASIDVHTVCRENISGFTPGMCGGLYSVPPGRHVVEVQSHFFGATTDPSPVQLTVETVCPGDVQLTADEEQSSVDQASDTGSGSSNTVTATTAVEDVGEAVADVDTDPTSSGPSASGCTLGSSSASGGAVALAGVLLVMARRRRNRR